MKLRIAALAVFAVLGACRTTGNVAHDGSGVYAVRSSCPIVGVPAGTGDITLFDPAGSTDSRSIDVTAAITDVRSICQDAGNDIISTATFTVVGLRRDVAGPRQVVLPYFDVAMQGGNTIVAKQNGAALLNFAAGSARASTRVQATVRVNRAAATLPDNVRQILTRRRRVGDVDAAIDPLSDPAVRKAVSDATFEHLVGFALTEAQIRYNATR